MKQIKRFNVIPSTARRVSSVKGYGDLKDSYFVTPSGQVLSARRGGKARTLAACPNGDGYLQCVVYRKDGTKRAVAIAPLVLKAFGPPCPGAGYTVDHINGIKTDNRVKNLRWLPRPKNVKHGHKVLTKPEITLIKVFKQFGDRITDIARILNIPSKKASRVLKGRTHKSVEASLNTGDVLIVTGVGTDNPKAMLYRADIEAEGRPKKAA